MASGVSRDLPRLSMDVGVHGACNVRDLERIISNLSNVDSLAEIIALANTLEKTMKMKCYDGSYDARSSVLEQLAKRLIDLNEIEKAFEVIDLIPKEFYNERLRAFSHLIEKSSIENWGNRILSILEKEQYCHQRDLTYLVAVQRFVFFRQEVTAYSIVPLINDDLIQYQAFEKIVF